MALVALATLRVHPSNPISARTAVLLALLVKQSIYELESPHPHQANK